MYFPSVILDIFHRGSRVFAFSFVCEDAGRHRGRPLPKVTDSGHFQAYDFGCVLNQTYEW